MGDHNSGDHQRRRIVRRWPLIVAGVIVAACVGFAVAWVAHPSGTTASSPPSSTSSTAVPVTATIKVACQDNSGDAARMQQAINGSPAGSAIEFEGGTCLLTKGLTLPGDRTYTGGSTTGTVLKQDGSAAYVLASTSYVDSNTTTGDPLAIRDLTIDCAGTGNTDGIILLNWQVDVEHVDLNNCWNGIVDTNTGANGHAISNTSVNSRFLNNFISGSGQYGFQVVDSGNSVTDGFLDNNQIADSGADAVHMANAEGWDISGNHLYGVKQDALNLSRIYGTTISGNYVEDFGDKQNSGTWYGLVANAQDGLGSTIVGNKIFNVDGQGGATYVYLAITGANSGTGYAAVTGNTIQGGGPGGVGLSFSGGGNVLKVTASGNNVTGVATKTRSGSGATVTGGS
ncbi:MAG: right-handed parallel beta-helix repeat-containing protein [Actinobacteria bacterium]|nr:right-handed parallel beta-helix repeat-containing protein [Actinomycetota bacterium]